MQLVIPFFTGSLACQSTCQQNYRVAYKTVVVIRGFLPHVGTVLRRSFFAWLALNKSPMVSSTCAYLLKRCGYEIMKSHHCEPFSGWVNALARQAVRTEPSAFEKPTATVTSEGGGKTPP